MAYISLYRKYRPKKFADVVGQDVVIKILTNSIISGKIGHAYIFSGPRGTGKTSVAKIFSKAVNCNSTSTGDICNRCSICKSDFNDEIDIIEIDAASNNGVEEIREIRNNVKLMPSHLKYKVYIIDEVHMLSSSAFNALLKTLEEPPSHVIFILATTEVNKIPSTVISRCQRFDFKKLSNTNIEKRLKYILKSEEKTLSEEVIKLIANLSDGGLRDAINIVDQLLNMNKEEIELDDVYNLIGDIKEEKIFEIMNNIISSNIKESLKILDNLYENGKSFINICDRLQMLIRNIIIYNNTTNYFDKEYEKKLDNYINVDIEKCNIISEILFELSNSLKKTSNQKTLMEIYFIKMLLIFSDKNDHLEEKDEKINVKSEESIKNEKEERLDLSYKKTRINNTLAEADKELKNKLANNYHILKEYLSNKEYNSISSLLLKGVPEVVSGRNILFTFKNNFEVVLFEKNIEEIQKLLKIIFNKKYAVVAVNTDDWEEIKKEYILSISEGKKYKYIPENNTQINKNKKSTVLQNTVEDIFGEDYVEIN